MRQLAAGLEADHDHDLHQQRAGRQDCADRLPARSARPGRFGSRADVRDDEEEHHHHGAGVDHHLRRGDEFG